MNSVCISSCINDARDTLVPVRKTYVNLYKWPESDAEFVRSVRRGGGVPVTRVVDSISCRQMYLRSYTFSREDDDKKSEKVTSPKSSCLGRVKETASFRWGSKEESDVIVDGMMKRRRRGEKRKIRSKKRQEQACSVMFRFFRRLLSCTASVDVVDPY